MKMRRLAITCAFLCAVRCFSSPQDAHIVLDMTPMAYDDQYINCTKEMANITSARLLKEEKENDTDFGGAWDKAACEWERRKKMNSLPPLPAGFQDNHGIAILVYTDKIYPSRNTSLLRRFNEAVRKSVTSQESYMKTFHFKALHFYLTTAWQLLPKSCRRVYRGIQIIQFEPPAGEDKRIRFGQFTSSSDDQAVAYRFGNDSYLNITTCYGVDIEQLSYYPDEKEVLIPANEIFRVSSFTKKGHKFVLQSTNSSCRYYNCAYFGGEKSKTCVSSSASRGALLISRTGPAHLFREFAINAVVLGLLMNL